MRHLDSMPGPGRRSVASFSAWSLATSCWCAIASLCQATTLYHVTIRTEQLAGQKAQVAFDLASGQSAPDSLEILNFIHDGRAAPVISVGKTNVEGGLVRGDLLLGLNPAARTIVGNDYFYNQLRVPFDSLGTFMRFDLRLPEPSPALAGLPDEMSFYYLKSDGTPAFETADPLAKDALFGLCVTGASGGDLTVFAPMTFVPPDTILLDLSTVGVPAGKAGVGLLQFRSIAPNPAWSGVNISYSVPEPGGELRVRVFDVAGRLVAEPFRGRRAAGTWTTPWSATDPRGHRLAAGIYMIQLQVGEQSIVRRIALVR